MKPILLLLASLCTAGIVSAQGFLFTTFKNGGDPMAEQIYFALSKDGRTWEALDHARPALVSHIGEKGVRDSFILRSHDGKKVYLIATDLSMSNNPSWTRATHAGSRSIVVWESTDLVHWSEPRLVPVAPPDAGCTWAPEAIYDDSTHDYLVFWASSTGRDHFAKLRIWAAHTSDFKTFGTPFIYIERSHSVIDTDIVRDGPRYYRFTKDETVRAITMETSGSPEGPWSSVTTFSLAHLIGYEGPECYLLQPAAAGQPATWCLILDHFAKGKGYEPFITQDLASGSFVPATGFKFPFLFRHGAVLSLTEDEYQRVKAAYASPAP